MFRGTRTPFAAKIFALNRQLSACIVRTIPSIFAASSYAELLDRRDAADLPFIVTAVDAHGGEEVIAAANHLHIATAAFTASVIAHPNARILLRHGVRVVSEHPAREAKAGE